jgi:hypothetical protein
MSAPLLASPFEALALSARIGAVGVAISSLELLTHPEQLDPGGIFGAGVELTRHRWTLHFRWLSPLPVAAGLVALRLAAAAALVVGASQRDVAAIGCAVVALTTLLIRVRTPLGIHASGAMATVTMVGAALGFGLGTTQAMQFALAFIAAQAALAYFVAGAAKMAQPEWRQGRALPLIASTVTWGGRREAVYLKAHAPVALALCWSTMVFECLVPASLALPLPLMICVLAGALAFHVVIAFEMGLNAFVWAYASTYPALIFAWYWLHGVRG